MDDLDELPPEPNNFDHVAGHDEHRWTLNLWSVIVAICVRELHLVFQSWILLLEELSGDG